MSKRLPITPDTKVAELLDHYPELEDVLIGLAPPFKKLKNPILRRSVAKVTSLRQAAAVGKISIHDTVNQLRSIVGQQPIGGEAMQDGDSYFSGEPQWFDRSQVVATIVEAELAPDVMPLNPLIRRVAKLEAGEIIELVTTYLPAPGIDIMREKGFSAWSLDEGEFIKTYFSKAVGADLSGTESDSDRNLR
jgi:hypothetical protein